MSKTQGLNIRVPAEIHKALKEIAEQNDRSLNGQIVNCLRSCVESRTQAAEQPVSADKGEG